MKYHNKYMSIESLLKADDEHKVKEKRVENQDTETIRTTTNLPQVCQACLREFRSRQALWGHSRIHKAKKEKEEDRYCDKNKGAPDRRGQKRKRDASTDIASSSRSCLKEEIVEDKFNIKEPCETVASSKNGKASIFESGDGSSKIASVKEEISTKPKKLYVCIDCDKTFYTHYAFGGHRSYHSKNNKKNRAHEEGSLPRQEADPTSRRIPLFDLNELPEVTGY